MKNYKAATPILLSGLMICSVYMTLSDYQKQNARLEGYLKNAREEGELGLLEDALENYQEALSLDRDMNVSLEVGELYVKNERYQDAMSWGEELVQQFPNEPSVYTFLLEQYVRMADYEQCFELDKKVEKKQLDSEKFREIMQKIAYVYETGYDRFENVTAYSGGFCAIEKDEGSWGYANENGTAMNGQHFQKAGAMVDGLAPVQDENGEWYYVSENGNKKKVVQNLKHCTYLGSCISGRILAADQGIYAFYDESFQKLSADYQGASCMNFGIAAVQKENGKWCLMNQECKEITKAVYEEIIQDEKETAFRNDRAFAIKENGSCCMLTGEGKEIAVEGMTDARIFASAEAWAAVKINGKWGFINREGEIQLEPRYQDARSFSNGLAAVKMDGKWGFIDETGALAILNEFDDARDFNDSGSVFVQTGGKWQILRLHRQMS